MSEWLMSLFQNVLRTSLFFLFVRSIWKRSTKSHTESDVQVIFRCCNNRTPVGGDDGVNKLFLMYGFVPPVIYLLMMYMRPTDHKPPNKNDDLEFKLKVHYSSTLVKSSSLLAWWGFFPTELLLLLAIDGQWLQNISIPKKIHKTGET